MKKLFAICFIINTYSFLANAQDIIIMKNGDEIKAKILEVRFDDIKYRKYDENNGAEYSIAKNSVKGINYQSGLKETFEKEEYIKSQRDAMGSFKPYTALLYGALSVPLGEYENHPVQMHASAWHWAMKAIYICLLILFILITISVSILIFTIIRGHILEMTGPLERFSWPMQCPVLNSNQIHHPTGSTLRVMQDSIYGALVATSVITEWVVVNLKWKAEQDLRFHLLQGLL